MVAAVGVVAVFVDDVVTVVIAVVAAACQCGGVIAVSIAFGTAVVIAAVVVSNC